MTATAATAVTSGRPAPSRPLRKWGPWIVLVAVAAVVLGIGLQRGGGKPSVDAQVQHIASQVRCPVCNGETVAQSQAAVSVEIRSEIRDDLQKGETQDEILSSLVSSYGTGILEKPQAKGISLLIWVVPVVALLLGAVGVAAIVRRWRSSGDLATRPDGPAPGSGSGSAGAADTPLLSRRGDDPAGLRVATGPDTDLVPSVVTPVDAASPDTSAGASSPVLTQVEVTPSPAPPPPAGRRRVARRTRLLTAGLGFVLVAGASWAVAASSGTRLPGQEITGQSLSSETAAADIEAATADEDRNDWYGALKLYQTVLKGDPSQVQALAGEGWLLAQTGQPALLKEGLAMLAQAEQVDPSYAASHLYRGLALLGEDDYGDSVPELQWYLAHGPDPKLVASVKAVLVKAQKGQAAAGSAPSSAPGSTTPTTPTTRPSS